MANIVKPKRIRSAKEREAGRSGFITLKKTGDQFVGYALFKPDPELKDNPGWYEYPEHFTPATGYVPCAGEEDCPLCEEGDNPSVRAKTLWFVPKDQKDPDPTEGEVKIFNLNWYVINDFIDLAADDEPVLGQLFRIKKSEGNGRFSIRPKKEKMNKTQLKAALDGTADLDGLVTKQLNRALQEMGVAAAMEDDDDENEETEEKSKSRKGKEKDTGKKGKGKDAQPDDDDDDGDEFDPESDTEVEGLTVTVVKVNKKQNIATVEHGDNMFDIYGTDDVDLKGYSKGDSITVDFEKDEDDDFVVNSVEEASDNEPEADPDDGDELPDKVEDTEVKILKIDTDEDIMRVEMEDGTEFDLYFPEDGEDGNGEDWEEAFDLDDYSEGETVTITATKDADDDLVADVFPVKAKSGKKGGKKGGKKKK